MLKGRFRAIARESRMKQGLRTSILGTRPRVFPPPGDRFAAQMTENQNYNWACPVSSPGINLASGSRSGFLGHRISRQTLLVE